jgi:hypothetical protein
MRRTNADAMLMVVPIIAFFAAWVAPPMFRHLEKSSADVVSWKN